MNPRNQDNDYSFTELPNELQSLIFGYVNKGDLFELRKVAKAIYTLSSQAFFNQHDPVSIRCQIKLLRAWAFHPDRTVINTRQLFNGLRSSNYGWEAQFYSLSIIAAQKGQPWIINDDDALFNSLLPNSRTRIAGWDREAINILSVLAPAFQLKQITTLLQTFLFNDDVWAWDNWHFYPVKKLLTNLAISLTPEMITELQLFSILKTNLNDVDKKHRAMEIMTILVTHIPSFNASQLSMLLEMLIEKFNDYHIGDEARNTFNDIVTNKRFFNSLPYDSQFKLLEALCKENYCIWYDIEKPFKTLAKQVPCVSFGQFNTLLLKLIEKLSNEDGGPTAEYGKKSLQILIPHLNQRQVKYMLSVLMKKLTDTNEVLVFHIFGLLCDLVPILNAAQKTRLFPMLMQKSVDIKESLRKNEYKIHRLCALAPYFNARQIARLFWFLSKKMHEKSITDMKVALSALGILVPSLTTTQRNTLFRNLNEKMGHRDKKTICASLVTLGILTPFCTPRQHNMLLDTVNKKLLNHHSNIVYDALDFLKILMHAVDPNKIFRIVYAALLMHYSFIPHQAFTMMDKLIPVLNAQQKSQLSILLNHLLDAGTNDHVIHSTLNTLATVTPLLHPNDITMLLLECKSKYRWDSVRISVLTILMPRLTPNQATTLFCKFIKHHQDCIFPQKITEALPQIIKKMPPLNAHHTAKIFYKLHRKLSTDLEKKDMTVSAIHCLTAMLPSLNTKQIAILLATFKEKINNKQYNNKKCVRVASFNALSDLIPFLKTQINDLISILIEMSNSHHEMSKEASRLLKVLSPPPPSLNDEEIISDLSTLLEKCNNEYECDRQIAVHKLCTFLSSLSSIQLTNVLNILIKKLHNPALDETRDALFSALTHTAASLNATQISELLPLIHKMSDPNLRKTLLCRLIVLEKVDLSSAPTQTIMNRYPHSKSITFFAQRYSEVLKAEQGTLKQTSVKTCPN